MAKYDTIGVNYNSTRKADPYLLERLIQNLRPVTEGTYLDIGCGTGNYSIGLYKSGYSILGIDPSKEMLDKAKKSEPGITWKLGTVENTSLETESVKGITATFTIHHWTDLPAGFKEMSRVLKAEGRMVMLTSTPEQMEGYWLNHYFPKMLRDSIVQMPSLEKVEAALNEASMSVIQTENYFVTPDLEDLFLYSGKQRPELYLDPVIRHGISSFSALASLGEVKNGLVELEQDISSGKIEEIISSYENQKGDYLYIVAGKK